MVSFHQSLHCSETWADSVMNSIMKIKQRKPTNKCFSEPTNIEHQGKLMDDIHFRYRTHTGFRENDVWYHKPLSDHGHRLHKIQLMSMMRGIMTMFWSNLFLTQKNIWCCDGKMNILCITTFTFYPTRETSSWSLHSTFTFTFYLSWQRDWCLLVGVCGNVCAISTNLSHYQPTVRQSAPPDYCQHWEMLSVKSGYLNVLVKKRECYGPLLWLLSPPWCLICNNIHCG